MLLWLLKDHSLSALLPDNLGRTATHIAANKCSLHALQTLHEFRQWHEFIIALPAWLLLSITWYEFINTMCFRILLPLGRKHE